MTWQMGIWLILVAAVSVGMLLGVLALTTRIQAIDERLAELRRSELELTRTFKWAVTNQTSELKAIRLRLDELGAQGDLFSEGTHRVELPKKKDIAALAPSEQIAVPEIKAYWQGQSHE
jgi:hypothetical protein